MNGEACSELCAFCGRCTFGPGPDERAERELDAPEAFAAITEQFRKRAEDAKKLAEQFEAAQTDTRR